MRNWFNVSLSKSFVQKSTSLKLELVWWINPGPCTLLSIIAMLWVRCCSSCSSWHSWSASLWGQQTLHHQSLTRAQPSRLPTLVTERESQSLLISQASVYYQGCWLEWLHTLAQRSLLPSPGVRCHQCRVLTTDQGWRQGRAGATPVITWQPPSQHQVTSDQAQPTWSIDCDTHHERATWGNQYITSWKVRIEHGQRLDSITVYWVYVRIRKSTNSILIFAGKDESRSNVSVTDSTRRGRSERSETGRRETGGRGSA